MWRKILDYFGFGAGGSANSVTDPPVERNDAGHGYDLGEVFTPSQPANAGFVPRPVQEYDLESALLARGTQVLIWGESGAGKSSVALRVLAQMGRPHVVTRCESTTSYEDILSSAFAQTGAMQVD